MLCLFQNGCLSALYRSWCWWSRVWTPTRCWRDGSSTLSVTSRPKRPGLQLKLGFSTQQRALTIPCCIFQPSITMNPICFPAPPERNPWKPSRMRSAQWSDRSRPPSRSCRCWRRRVSNGPLPPPPPLFNERHSWRAASPAGAFDLLVYTDKDLVVPDKWEESGPQIISQSEEVRLRSFTTSIHKVSSMVAYKRSDCIWSANKRRNCK